MTGDSRLAAVVASARFLLLDFDGPVCSIFAGYPAPTVATELRRVLVDLGVTIPATVTAEPDPMEVLRYAGTIGRTSITRRTDDALTAAEVTAARTAEPTPYAREVIVSAHHSGRRIAVVSNNSAAAVSTYLRERRLAGYIHPVIGRAYAEPDQMKPNPAPLLTALRELQAGPADCVLVGDSLSDVEAARAAKVPVIGYANKEGKTALLADADAIITDMAELATALADGEL